MAFSGAAAVFVKSAVAHVVQRLSGKGLTRYRTVVRPVSSPSP
jgi:hypothetical protein